VGHRDSAPLARVCGRQRPGMSGGTYSHDATAVAPFALRISPLGLYCISAACRASRRQLSHIRWSNIRARFGVYARLCGHCQGEEWKRAAHNAPTPLAHIATRPSFVCRRRIRRERFADCAIRGDGLGVCLLLMKQRRFSRVAFAAAITARDAVGWDVLVGDAAVCWRIS
jgi:hypothetical protein